MWALWPRDGPVLVLALSDSPVQRASSDRAALMTRSLGPARSVRLPCRPVAIKVEWKLARATSSRPIALFALAFGKTAVGL